MMAASAARPHSVAYSDKRRAASVDFQASSGGSSAKRSVSTSLPRKSRSKTPEVVGQYILYSTLGQGSMGKVKLARHRKTGQLAAVKILPILSLQDPSHKSKDPRDTPEHRHRRTEREIAIMLLLNHSNICKLLHWEIHDNNYYIFLEYVDGGQLLDYIIRHGKLKETQARKFGRQILSAIDYCHRNSIVHRDLKIENILLTRDENIKIIDFGLSNIYSPRSVLSTFCGSLYFAAPELLQAKKYTGPEVDIWSFGVVLFVLVAGRVPFDDTSMPALHAKIKAGVIEYPDHMSRECVDLLKSILVVDSSKRATISQIAAHPWLNKRYEQPIDNELPRREPLTVPIDMAVVEGMHGFGLGNPEDIKQRLEGIIETPEYQSAAKVIHETSETYRIESIPQPQHKWRLKEKSLKKVIIPAKDDPLSQPAMYDPLVSIYYLVKEQQESSSKDLIHAHDIAVPDLAIAEKSKPILANADETPSSEKKASTEASPSPSRKSSPLANNHIKFSSATKPHGAENKITIPPSSDTKTEKRSSKRLSALFQSKLFNKDFKDLTTPSDTEAPHLPTSFENLSKSNAKPAQTQLIPIASLSTPAKKNTFQQNVNTLGRRLTFKPKSSKPTATEPEPKASNKSTDPASKSEPPRRASIKSPSMSLSLDSRKSHRTFNGSNGNPKKAGESAGNHGFQLFKMHSLRSANKDLKPKHEALLGLKGLAKNQLFHGPPEQLYQHVLKVLEELNIDMSIKNSFVVLCQWGAWKEHLQEKSAVSVNAASNSSRSSNTLDSILQRRGSAHNNAKEPDGKLSPNVTVHRNNSSRRSSHTPSVTESLPPSNLVFEVVIFSVNWAKRYGIRVQANMENDNEQYSYLFKKAEQLILNAVEARYKNTMIVI